MRIASVSQGKAITFVTTLYSPNEHKNVCGAPNYYIDDYAASGKWNINPPGMCSASSGSLSFSGADTAKLSLGTHTLKVDYLGDSTHAGSQFVEQFTVTSPPTPSLFPSITPTPTVLPGPCNCYGPDLDCKDFTQAQAQACYDHCKAVTGRDVFDLDRDHDGIACEDNA